MVMWVKGGGRGLGIMGEQGMREEGVGVGGKDGGIVKW